MRPHANLLLTFGIQVFPIGDIPHTANHQRLDLALFGPIHHGPAHLVFHIPRPALLFGEKARLPSLESTKGAGPFLLAVLLGLEFTEPFGPLLLVGSQRPTGDDNRLLTIGDSSRVYLA